VRCRATALARDAIDDVGWRPIVLLHAVEVHGIAWVNRGAGHSHLSGRVDFEDAQRRAPMARGGWEILLRARTRRAGAIDDLA